MQFVYTIERKDGKVFVYRENGTTVYSSVENAYIIHKQTGPGNFQVTVECVKDLNDVQLLTALANAVRLDEDKGK